MPLVKLIAGLLQPRGGGTNGLDTCLDDVMEQHLSFKIKLVRLNLAQ